MDQKVMEIQRKKKAGARVSPRRPTRRHPGEDEEVVEGHQKEQLKEEKASPGKESSPMPQLEPEEDEVMADSPPPNLEQQVVLRRGTKKAEEEESTFIIETVPAPKITYMSRASPPKVNRHLEAAKRTRPNPDMIRGNSTWKRTRISGSRFFDYSADKDGEDDFFFDDSVARSRNRDKLKLVSRPMEEVAFDEDDEMKFSENGCPVYCSMPITLTLAQMLIFKEDKDLDRCCTKIPNTYAGQHSVYLVNLQECDDVSCYSDIAEDVYGSWGGCAVRCLYFKYLEDGSVERVEGGAKAFNQDWDFSIQENIYNCHPITKKLDSQLKKKIFTVRYNGKSGEIVKTWAIIVFEWSGQPIDVEFPPPKRMRLKAGPAVVDEGGTVDVDDEDAEDDTTVKYSGNGCPVYSTKAITHKLAEEIIFDPDKRMDLCCEKIPSGYVGRRSVFLLNLQKMRNVNVFGDLTVDSYGSWGSCNANCWYYRYGEDDTVERISGKGGRRPELDAKWDFILQENSYSCHPQTRNLPSRFKRKVYTIRDKRAPGEIVKTWAVIGYVWTGRPIKFEVAPHGNCRKEESLNAAFHRTRPTVRKMLEEKLHAGFSPKDVFAQTHEELGGVIGADTAADLPSSKKQVYNIQRYLRKANLIPTPKEMKARKAIPSEPWLPSEPWDPSKNNNIFLLEYDFLNEEPIVLCGDDRMLNMLRMYCLLDEESEREIRPLYLETTFELGPTFITPVFTQHPELEERLLPHKEPIIPIAFLISKNKTKEEFRWLGDALRRKSGAGERERVSAVITDDDPEMFGGLSECSLFDEPCCFILCGVNLQNNVRSVLEECRLEPSEVTRVLGQIFGKEHQFSVDKGRIRRGERGERGLIDCGTVQEFDEMLEEYEEYWDPTFYNWFVRYKVPYIRNRFFVSGNDGPSGWINANRIEAMKFWFQQSLMGNYSEDNIVEVLRNYTDSVISKIEGAPFDMGEFQVKDESNRWAVKSDGVHFNDTTKAARIARLAEFGLNRSLKDVSGQGRPSVPARKMFGGYRIPSLSMSLGDNLSIPYLTGTYGSRVTQCERAAAKFIADDCVKQLKNKAQYAVEDVVASISAIFVVERCGGGGLRCQFGFQVCEAFKMFRSTFCEHTVAVAEFNGELKEHIQHINNNFPEAEEHQEDRGEVFSTPQFKGPAPKKFPPRKVIEVVNPLRGETTENVKSKGSESLDQESSTGYPTARQLQEIKKQKPLMFDGKAEHAYYNSNPFYLKQGAPPPKPEVGKIRVKCKKCKGPFVMPKDPGYMPPADMYIVHDEVDVIIEHDTGDIIITEDEIPIYLHSRYSCVAERYPFFFPEGYLKCGVEDRKKLQKAHEDEIRAQFGVSLEEIADE